MKKFPEPQAYSTEPRPQIVLQPVESSQIADIGYNPLICTLAVRFKHGIGAIYHYPNVSLKTFTDFKAAESKGSFFAQNIKALAFDKFPPEPSTHQSPTTDPQS